MNSCNFVGNLTRDPELRSVGETSVVNFSLAVNERPYKDKASGEMVKPVSFFDFELWGSGGEAIHKYSKKGHKLSVTCTAKQDVWEDKESGQKRSKVRFRVTSFDFLTSNANAAGGEGDDGDSEPKHQEEAPKAKRGRPAKKAADTAPEAEGAIPF